MTKNIQKQIHSLYKDLKAFCFQLKCITIPIKSYEIISQTCSYHQIGITNAYGQSIPNYFSNIITLYIPNKFYIEPSVDCYIFKNLLQTVYEYIDVWMNSSSPNSACPVPRLSCVLNVSNMFLSLTMQ